MIITRVSLYYKNWLTSLQVTICALGGFSTHVLTNVCEYTYVPYCVPCVLTFSRAAVSCMRSGWLWIMHPSGAAIWVTKTSIKCVGYLCTVSCMYRKQCHYNYRCLICMVKSPPHSWVGVLHISVCPNLAKVEHRHLIQYVVWSRCKLVVIMK